MKLFEVRHYKVPGPTWALSLFKFRRRVLFDLELERTHYEGYTFLFQMGDMSVIYVGLCLGRYGLSLSILGKNYGS